MRGWAKRVPAVMGRILILGFGVQIMLGVVWALVHIGSFQEFQESIFLQKVSESLICDEYTGILYPFLIRIVQGIEKVISIPYFSMIYFCQVATAAGAVWFFLSGFVGFRGAALWKKIWVLLSVLTFPMVLQCLFAVLPIALAVSAFLVQLGVAWRILQKKENAVNPAKKEEPILHELVFAGIAGLTAGLFIPAYKWFSDLLLLVCAIFEILKSKKKELNENLQNGADVLIARIVGVTLITTVFLIAGSKIPKWYTVDGAYGRMQNTWQAVAFRRFAWDDFGELYADWPKELVDAISQDEIAVCNRYPLRKEWILGRRVDGVYGREKAKEIYGQVQAVAAKVRFSRNGKEMLRDFSYYLFAPPAQLYLMEGKGQATLSGRNFDIMRQKHPKLTTLFVRYAYGWFTAAMLLSVMIGVLQMFAKDMQEKRKWLRQAFWYVVIACAFASWFTMQGGGIMDYKNGLVITMLWTVWMCFKALWTVPTSDHTA